jgi:signal transduction histidine kinase
MLSPQRRAWLAAHKQRLAYVLIAVSIAFTVGAATVGGFHLHHAADLERQTLRTQRLGGAAFQLQDFLSRAQVEQGVSGRLATERAHAVATAQAAFAVIRRHNRGEGERIRSPYLAYMRGSTRAFGRATADHGRIPAAEQREVARRLARLESRVDAEIDRLGRATRVTNPDARLALIVAVLAAAILVGVLIWQFEMQRRAGRIDRDNAKRAEELIRLRDEFVATVSHELRTPLTSIMGYLELIGDDESGSRTPEQQAFLEIVQRNAERLVHLVSDLLLVAESQDRRLSIDVKDIDLGALAAECVAAAKPAADAREIQLSLSDGSPGRLDGDPVRLAQVIDNLISNAIKFTPAGGRVTVRATTSDGQALFEVSDTGAGISAADLAQLFEPFFRTRSAAAQAIQGTGLGLTITKAIVEAHKGSISVDSVLGDGTTFRVRLPQTQPGPGRRTPSAHAAAAEL